MKKYGQFVLEMLSSSQESIVDKVITYLNENSESLFYPYDEDFEVTKLDVDIKLIGKLFLMNDGRAIRLNFDKEMLYSIDLWKDFEFDDEKITNQPYFTMLPKTADIDKYLDDMVDFVNEEFELYENKEEPEIKKSGAELVKLKSFSFSKSIMDQDLDVFDSIAMYTRQVAFGVSNSLIVSGQAGVGKCLGKGTKVVMYNGDIRKVEDIKKGDLLMGPNSKPRKVISLNNDIGELYEVKQNKGMNYVVNDEHILSLKKSTNAKNTNEYTKYNDYINMPIKEYIKMSKTFKRNFLGYKVGIDFDEKPLTIEPYYLGIWLGDGNSKDTSVTTIDDEIENYISEYANNIGQISKKYKYGEKTPFIKIISEGYHTKGIKYENELFNKMRDLNLINNKHIPKEYLSNTENNRLELLAGLIDSDGYKITGGYEITLKSEMLINQIKFLADSLGYKTSMRKRKGKIKKLNFIGDYYRVSINGDIERIPVKIERKRNISKRKVDHKVTGIKIKHIGEGEYYGFVLDSDHLFLLEDCTVTHNTVEVTNILEETRVEYESIKGDISTAGLYETLFLNNGKLTIFDDCDSVWKNTESINLLKAALDTKKEREISRIIKTHFDASGMKPADIMKKYKETNKLPKQFTFTGRCIFITNVKGEDMDPAVVSRSLHVDVNLTKDEVIERLRKILDKIFTNISHEIKEETLEFVSYLMEEFTSKFPLSIRTMIHALNIRVSNDYPIQHGDGKVQAWMPLIKQFLVKK